MLTATLNTMAAAIIFFWALWCIFAKGINDGIFGKIVYSFAALAAFALLVGQHTNEAAINPSDALNWAMAVLGVRHLTLRYLWPAIWRQVQPCSKCERRRASDS